MTAPALTKKHFVFLADALAEARAGMADMHDCPPDVVADFIVDHLCLRLSATNPSFDADRFREACNFGQQLIDLSPR